MAALLKSQSMEAIQALLWISLIVRVVLCYEEPHIPPSFFDEPSTNVIFSNSTGGRVLCSAEGHPNPKITWLLADGSTVNNVQGLRHVQIDGTLIFPPFRAEDYRQDVHATVYKCSASNSIGTLISKDVQVKGVVSQPYETYVYDVYAIKGNSAVMKCHIPQLLSDYVKVISWVRDSAIEINGKHLNSYTKYEMMPNGDLYIKDVNAEDSLGTFRCQVRDLLSGVKKTSITAGKLFITEPQGPVAPKILNGKDEMLAKEGEVVFLPCVAQGNPSPSIKWVKFLANNREEEVQLNGRRRQVSGSLLIRNIQSSDTGIYICIASNSAGMVKRQTQLTVAIPLDISIQPSEATVDIGRPLKLTCKITGNPVEKITWLHDGKPVSGENIAFESNDTLHIRSMTIKEKGIYQCFVRNDLQIQFGTSILKLGDVSPSFSNTFEEQILHPGSTTSMTCEVVGIPTPVVSWSVDGIPLSSDGKIRIEETFSMDDHLISKLIIKDLKTEDGGLYSCTASNKAGQATHSKRLNVYGPLSTRRIPKVNVVNSQKAFLDCPFYGYPHGVIEWEKDNILLPDNIRQTIFENGTLMIQKVFKNLDSGTYKCYVHDENDESVEGDVQLAVLVAPKIIPFSFQDVNVVEGTLARVSCVVYQGDLPITIQWLKDNLPISPSLDIAIRRIDDYSSILTIENVQRDHTGNYSCTANNKAATITHSAQLIVNVPPKIVPFTFQDGNILEGMLVRVSCVISRGDLPLRITWLKDNLPVSSEKSIVVKDFDEYSSVLSIDPVGIEHNGNYTCVASNNAGTVSYTTQLKIQVPPKWIIEPIDTTVANGEDGFLHCKTEGLPVPTVTWMRSEGTKMSRRKTVIPNENIIIYKNGTLHLKHVTKLEEGHYFCSASNDVGSPIGKSISLSVNSPPVINLTELKYTAKKGNNVSLICSCSGNLPIEIQWMMGSKIVNIQKDQRFRIKNEEAKDKNGLKSILTVLWIDRKDTTNVRCIARNEYGQDEAGYIIIVQESPDPPVLETPVNSYNRSISLKWKPGFDGNSKILRYIIQYKKQIDNWQYKSINQTVDGSKTSFVINDLQPATTYQLKISAENEIGKSAFSEVVSISVDEDVPSGAPQNIEVESTDTHTLRITWKPPKKSLWHGAIRGYNIGYRIHGSDDPFAFTTLEVPEDYTEDLIYQLTNLQLYTQYGIIVQAYNSKGIGPSSEEVLAMTSEDVPQSPPEDIRCSALSSKSIYVLWEPPQPETVNGILRGYKVIYKPAEEYFIAQSHVTQNTKVTLQELFVNTNYSIQILAFTKVGDGIPSIPIYCKTHEDVPEALSSVKVLPSSSDSVMVSWKPPQKSSGSITKYNVYYKPLEDGQEMEWDLLPSGDSSIKAEELNKGANVHSSPSDSQYFEVKGLKKNKKYAFWVTASSVIGEGPVSQVKAETVADSNVAAKSASFDDEIQTPWKKDVVLSCRAVGVPPPQKKWFSGNKPLEQTPRTTLLSDGTLLINRVTSEDSGNYTCSIYNEYGRDEIKYSVIVQVPPSAPLLDVVSKSKTSIQLQWKAGPTGGDRIKGYNLNFRKTKGTWETQGLRPDLNVYTLTDLACGNTYEVYMEAFNSIGTGPPCDIITVSTEGAEMVPPAKEDLIREGTTFITVNLDSWPSNGCPVITFGLEYKQGNAKDWTLVATNIKSTQKKLVIPGLSSATWYNLRLIAQTTGEATVAEYKFATHTPNGGTVAPETLEEDIQPVYIFYLDPYIFIPAVALLIVVIIASAVVCIVMKRRNGSEGTPSVFYSDDGSNLNTWTHRTLRKSGNTFIHSDGYATINPRNSDLNPYASSQLADYNPAMSGFVFNGPNAPISVKTLPRKPGNSEIPIHGPLDNRQCSAVPGVEETTFVFPGNMHQPPFSPPGRGKTEDGYDHPPFGI